MNPYSVLVLASLLCGPGASHSSPTAPVKADPEATRLFQEARAARALWASFPGFTADIEVNRDGKVSRGTVQIDSTGKVTLHKLDREAERWARPVLASTVGHRLDSGPGKPACVFVDDQARHPLGRAVRLLGDGMGSNYRIRDRQVVVVNRRAGKVRFSITLLESRLNKEGKYLPTSFVVHTWDADTGSLRQTEAHSHTWKRLGRFDLPVMTRVVTTGRESSARTITLSNHKLLGPHD